MGSADSRDHCGEGFEIPGVEEEMFRDSPYVGVEWWMSQELEIPEENGELMGEPMSSSSRSVSTSTNESSSLSPSASAEESCQNGLKNMPALALPALNKAAPVKEWLCEDPKCGQSFTHRYKLKYVSPPLPTQP